MKEKKVLNFMLRSSTNKFLWIFVKSYYYDKAEGDYLIEYSNAYEKVNGEKYVNNEVTRKSYLSDFGENEASIIYELIKGANVNPKQELVLSTIYI